MAQYILVGSSQESDEGSGLVSADSEHTIAIHFLHLPLSRKGTNLRRAPTFSLSRCHTLNQVSEIFTVKYYSYVDHIYDVFRAASWAGHQTS